MGHWERLTMIEAVKKYSGVDFNDWKTDEEAIAAAKEHHVELPEVPTKGAILAEFFDTFVEDKLIQPTFIYDYPVEISPLAKRKPDDPAFTERFEYFIDCTEYGNAFSRPEGPLRAPGRRAQGHRARLQGPGRLRLRQRSGVRSASHGRPRLRRGPPCHAPD
jgi:lysyl-tRNA synthetase class 2